MRLTAKLNSSEATLKLEDKITGELFAKCPIDTYPGLAIQSVADSSRYFVIHVKDDSGQFYSLSPLIRPTLLICLSHRL
jgi:hypothetical protein